MMMDTDLPSRSLSVVPVVVASIRMYQRTKWTSMYDQPWDKRSELLRGEEIDLKHPDRVRPYRSIEDVVNAQFRDYGPCKHQFWVKYG